MRPGIGGLVSVMEYENPLEEEERQEARSHERPDDRRVREQIDRLGQDVEESDCDHDSAAEGDHRGEGMRHAQRKDSAGHCGDHRDRRQRDGDQLVSG
jgi:hypothetical protein